MRATISDVQGTDSWINAIAFVVLTDACRFAKGTLSVAHPSSFHSHVYESLPSPRILNRAYWRTSLLYGGGFVGGDVEGLGDEAVDHDGGGEHDESADQRGLHDGLGECVDRGGGEGGGVGLLGHG